jgi:cell cycle checkpoint control protein RAD9A
MLYPAVILLNALLAFVRALTCLSRYGDEILIHATAQTMSVSATSQSMSAYCRFMWDRQFFVRYMVQATGDSIHPEGSEDGEGIDESVKGQLLVKVITPLLSVWILPTLFLSLYSRF